MADDFKTTVSRTLTTNNRQYTNVLWQAGKPPLDSELNLVGQIATDNLAKTVSANAHSGVLMNPRSTDRDFTFNPLWSNYLKVKPFKALVNGLSINIEEATVNLSPPPTQDNRIDFVFLEVWKTIISAEGSGGDLTNKPTNTEVYLNGNTSGSGSEDEMVDGNVGFETTKRVQVQYRFRVVDGIDIYTHIEGMSSGLVFAQGPLSGVSAVSFTNQYANEDSGLWVADMTATNSPLLSENVIYGLPICAVSRRNDNAYVATAIGSPNQNGAINRKPSSVNNTDATLLTQATLTSFLTQSTLGEIALSDLVGSGLDDASLYGSNRYLIIGVGKNKETIRVSGINGSNLVVVARGEGGTQAKYHSAGTSVVLFNNRPDGKYSDQIHQNDVFDMRHATTLGEWDYQSLLESSLSDLLFGKLKSAFKQNQINNTSAGTTIEEVSVLDNQAGLTQVQEMDYPNGFRDTWSDASIPQMGVTLYLSTTSTNSSGITTVNLDFPDESNWDIGPSLSPTAFLFDNSPKMKSGSWIKLTLNTASNLTTGVNSPQTPTNLTEVGMRFIAPKEIKDASVKRPPFTIEELGENHRPLSYPTLATNFEKPFIVFGRSKYSTSITTSVSQSDTLDNYVILYQPSAHTDSEVIDPLNGGTQTDLDLVVAVRLGADNINTPSEINTLESLVTSNGYDVSGKSSKLYSVIYGDPVDQKNNGVFKVVNILNDDADTPNAKYYKDKNKTVWTPNNFKGFIILKPIDDIARSAGLGNNKVLTVDFRTQEITDKDESILISITESTAHNIPASIGQLSIDGEFQLGFSVLYPSTTGGTANVADEIHKIGIVPPTQGVFLNNSKSVLHGSNFANIPLVENEIDLPTQNHVSLWNRLPSSNLPIGVAKTSKMGGRIINEEADREAESFTDEKSKSLILRPYQNKTVVINKAITNNLTANNVSIDLIPEKWNNNTGDPVDDEMFLLTRNAAYILPEALMPRFGRQDIPFHTYTSNVDTFRDGINHIFIDKPLSTSDNIFNIIGGKDNVGNPGVSNALFITGETYGKIDSYVSINNRKAIGSQKRVNGSNELQVPTSDFGPTLQGIELPPFYGIARVYGVYERDLFHSKLAQTDNLGGHEVNRITPKANVTNGQCPNLLRTDTSAFTLYINQNGGNSLVNNTTYTNAHTYVLTEHAIDITRLQGIKHPTTLQDIWSEASTFDSFDYVVEAVVFMFTDGFITHNRYVLPRNHNGSGTQLVNTTTSKLIVDSVIPFAPPLGSHITVAYKRTPYQGDPLLTQGQLDQVTPQGRKSLADLVLGTKTQPVSLANTNKRNLQVLASMDFYTTLGTGKMGGEVYPTTITDVGHTSFPSNRNPSALITDGLTYIPFRSSTFTQESDLKGGWSSLFLFEKAVSAIKDKVTLALYKNGTSVSTLAIVDPTHDSLAKQVVSVQVWLQDLGYDNFQTRGEISQLNVANQNYFGVLIQSPNPTDSFEIEVQWKDLRNGQSIQVFEGLRESPMSFEMYDGTSNYEYKLNNRSKNKASFSKIVTNPLNAGDGNIPLSLVGMTSRLPLGSLVRDSDFVCEDILSNKSSYLFSSTGSFSTISNPVPVSPNGVPYTQTLGLSGDVLQMNDGVLFNGASPATQTKYSISRGGGSVFGVSGDIPGSPLSFLATSFGSSLQPVLKGSALACRAMLVRNFYEEDDSSETKSYGDELQLLVITHAIDGGSGSITLGGDISPSGYGEGFSASDRFRIKGKPLVKNYGQNETLDVTPAPFNSNS